MYKKCFVACLDILGFKSFVEDEDMEASTIIDRLSKLKKLSEILTGSNHPESNPKIHPILMSDTLLLFSEKDDEISFKYVAGIVAESICLGIGLSITNIAPPPMRFRGAISWGNFYYDKFNGVNVTVLFVSQMPHH